MPRKSYLASKWDSDDDLLDTVSLKNEKDDLDKETEEALLGGSDDEDAAGHRFEFIVNDDEFEEFEEDFHQNSQILEEETSLQQPSYPEIHTESYEDVSVSYDNLLAESSYFEGADTTEQLHEDILLQPDQHDSLNSQIDTHDFGKDTDLEDEEEDDDDARRARFKAERPPDIRQQLSRKNTNIPEKLEISQEDEKKITEFMHPKKQTGFKKPFNVPRQPHQYRGATNNNKHMQNNRNMNNMNPMRTLAPLVRNIVNFGMQMKAHQARAGVRLQQNNQVFGQQLRQNRPHFNQNRPNHPNYEQNRPNLPRFEQNRTGYYDQNMSGFPNERFTSPLKLDDDSLARIRWSKPQQKQKTAQRKPQNQPQNKRMSMVAQKWQDNLQQNNFSDPHNFSSPGVLNQPIRYSNMMPVRPNQPFINQQPQQSMEQHYEQQQQVQQPFIQNTIQMRPMIQGILGQYPQQNMVRVVQLPQQQPMQRMLIPNDQHQLHLQQKQQIQIPVQQTYVQTYTNPTQQPQILRLELNPRPPQVMVAPQLQTQQYQKTFTYQAEEDNLVGQPIETVVANRSVRQEVTKKKPMVINTPQQTQQNTKAQKTSEATSSVVPVAMSIDTKNAANRFEAEQQRKLLARARRFGDAPTSRPPVSTAAISLKRRSSEQHSATEGLNKQARLGSRHIVTSANVDEVPSFVTPGNRKVVLNNKMLNDEDFKDIDLQEKLKQQKQCRLEILKRKEQRRKMFVKNKLAQTNQLKEPASSTPTPTFSSNQSFNQSISQPVNLPFKQPPQPRQPFSFSSLKPVASSAQANLAVRAQASGVGNPQLVNQAMPIASTSKVKTNKVHKMVVTKEQYLAIVKQMQAKGLTGPTVVNRKKTNKNVTNSNGDSQRKVVISNTNSGSKRILIDGLTTFTKIDKLRSLAQNIGPIENIELKQQKALIDFCDPKHAIQFAANFNRHMIDLALVTVSIINNN